MTSGRPIHQKEKTVTLDEDEVQLICRLLRAYGDRQLRNLIADTRTAGGRIKRLKDKTLLAATLIARIEN